MSTANLLRRAAAALRETAEGLRDSCTVGDRWPDPEDRELFDSEMALVCELEAEAERLASERDPLGEAMNSGNGVYRP